MKIRIDFDEWPEVYSVSDHDGVEADVPAETLARWARVESEYCAVQNEMRAAVIAANGTPFR